MLNALIDIAQTYPYLVGGGLGSAFALTMLMRRKKTLDSNQLAAIEAKHFADAGFFPKKLLTPNELHFYKRLRQAAGPSRTVLPQIGLGALIDTALPEGHEQREFERRKFVGKLLDFVVVDAKTLEVLFVVELDDRTHNKLKDNNRDVFLKQAGYKTVRYESRFKPTVEQLRNDFERIASFKPH